MSTSTFYRHDTFRYFNDSTKREYSKLTGASGRAVRCTTPVLACLLATAALRVLNNLRDAATCATLLNISNGSSEDIDR